MMHGRNNGKKLMAVRIVKHAMEIIHLLTDANPIQIIVDSVINRYNITSLLVSVITRLQFAMLNKSFINNLIFITYRGPR
ncbi:putative ribosomal protein S5/S7 [Helianthus annuus]|uniref:Ribosomal protein S5/S7 n=1 Tax=Helianthus annuus TaxID=4232 RepID=A0A9K3P0Q3_HELAN|nr:putative ribosomal protein S5/S7 [Helianthus annuus]KAJ0619797.1 putative ribosomal protein S5/S7 [Helianthus annuus]KAJ0778256.1 putative ribosomal protein S5/S7 [Helianthus annuus]KAJ0787238.1 putative ribosomal protein S5/S7 [Helianthus annuus]KAJ0806367.1 putative ribosomal protein S5/S7 [Helianthus annuus]